MTVVPPAPESSAPRRPPAQTERSFSELPPCADGRPKIKNGHSFSPVIPGTLSNYRNLLIVAKNMKQLTRPVDDGGPAPGECGHRDGARYPWPSRSSRSGALGASRSCTAPARGYGSGAQSRSLLRSTPAATPPRAGLTRHAAGCRLSSVERTGTAMRITGTRSVPRVLRPPSPDRQVHRNQVRTKASRERSLRLGRCHGWKSTQTTLAAVAGWAMLRRCPDLHHSRNAIPPRPRSTATTRQLTDRVSECPTSAQAETRRPASGPSPQAPCSVDVRHDHPDRFAATAVLVRQPTRVGSAV